jgi:hypothetical protein
MDSMITPDKPKNKAAMKNEEEPKYLILPPTATIGLVVGKIATISTPEDGELSPQGVFLPNESFDELIRSKLATLLEPLVAQVERLKTVNEEQKRVNENQASRIANLEHHRSIHAARITGMHRGLTELAEAQIKGYEHLGNRSGEVWRLWSIGRIPDKVVNLHNSICAFAERGKKGFRRLTRRLEEYETAVAWEIAGNGYTSQDDEEEADEQMVVEDIVADENPLVAFFNRIAREWGKIVRSCAHAIGGPSVASISNPHPCN